MEFPQKITIADNSGLPRTKTTVLCGNKIVRYECDDKSLFVVDIDLFSGGRITRKHMTEYRLENNSALFRYYFEGKLIDLSISSDDELSIKTAVLSGSSGEISLVLTITTQNEEGNEKKSDGDGKIEIETDFDGNLQSKSGSAVLRKVFLRGKTKNAVTIKRRF